MSIDWRKGYAENGRTLVIAHRGASTLAAENSAAAFDAALALGVDGIETDGRLTRDGVAVAFHDNDLMRMAGDGRAVADVDFAELSALVPGALRLSAAANRIVAGAGLMLDVKERVADRALALFTQVGGALATGRVLVAVRGPEVPAALAPVAPEAVMLALPWAPDAITETWGAPWLRLWEEHATGERIAHLQAQGLRVLVMMGTPTAGGSGFATEESVAGVLARRPDAICLDDARLALGVQRRGPV